MSKQITLFFSVSLTAVVLIGSNADANEHDSRDLSSVEMASVTRAVQDFMAAVARDITAEGPLAWRKYLSQKQAFIMASNGQLVFGTGEAAQGGIAALEQTIKSIELQWGKDLHVDPLSQTLAGVGVPFHEVLVQKTGQRVSVDGYFTALVERGDSGWQFRNAHWSVPSSPAVPK